MVDYTREGEKTQNGRIKYKGGTKLFNPILILSKKVS